LQALEKKVREWPSNNISFFRASCKCSCNYIYV
jgi:hypothetical protein